MSVNGVAGTTQVYYNKSTEKPKDSNSAQKTVKKDQTSNDTAAVYEKLDQTQENKPADTKKIYQRDNATVERLMEESEKRAQSLRDLVEKMLLKQGQTMTDATDIYALLREGKVDVDPETSTQAKKDVAEDGYWGVNQTSDRLVSFAMALAGSDPSKADLMIDAVKKGYGEAGKTWGGELPSICKDTLDAAISKLQKWRDSNSENESEAES
ncbi:MAG TPA: hypothetical protein VN131_04405 [Mobilitalea sp.]|nr:hypothetical protein [Mobilitalea sp.]